MKSIPLAKKKLPLLLIALILLFLVMLTFLAGWIEQWLWMRQLGYVSIFWKLLGIKFVSGAIAFLVAFGYLWFNLHIAQRRTFSLRGSMSGDRVIIFTKDGAPVSSGLATIGTLVISGGIALIFAYAFYPQWDKYLRFFWGGDFGQVDPIFGKDIGYYVFHLPFFGFVQNALMGLTLVTLIAVVLSDIYFGVFAPGQLFSSRQNWPVIGHMALLFVLFIASWAWGIYLDRFELLYSKIGVVYGIGYTADHVTRISLWIMLIVAIALMGIIPAGYYMRRFKLILIGAGSYFVLYFLIVTLLPGMIQKYVVRPSELELETPYLRHNIDFTRKAFGLDKIEEKAYPALRDLTLEDSDAHKDTIQNIRLWDWRPMLQTYRQTQEIRLYYQFYDVDVDRYHMADGYHQVMLSARELAEQLPPKARTWVNQYLQFTHGYGLVMNFVSKKQGGGLPVYAIENIPPESRYGLRVDQPAIYYGEKMPGYRIVTTQVKEFDYPKGNQNVYAQYTGKGGIPLDSMWKKVLFAWTRSDINILLTTYTGSDSRIQLWRSVQDRVAKIAPFLQLDKDPYLVLSQGKLFWIQDAYTTSDRFPYAEPYKAGFTDLNYVRNSVKVVVDVYDGSVSFYSADPADPILAMYRRAFPGTFKQLDELPPDLKAHLRYPEDLFSIQADVYRTYHMTDPQVFYNQEDLWTVPQEKYAGEAIALQPYYMLMRLPNTDKLQYLLMTPFTPQNRDNMISWMGAKCDFPDYGKMVVYQLPKERLTFGPIQIEARIDQNAVISEQLSLWDQRGSRIIRGNLLVIPIENSFLYVEPVYLTAEGTNIPQLIRIIVVSGDKVVMEPTLDEAISAVFGSKPLEKKAVPIATAAEPDQLVRAREKMNAAQEALQQGKWEEFGKAMEALKDVLKPKPDNK